jgi:prolyl oligopeptidase
VRIIAPAIVGLGALLGHCLLPLASSEVQAAEDATAQLHTLFDTEWERGLRENPTSATYLGDHRFDDRWSDRSGPAIERSHRQDQAVLEQLERIPPGSLSAADQLNRDLFRRLYQGSVDAYRYGAQYLPMSHKDSIASAHERAELIDFRTVRDYEQWIAGMDGLGTLTDQTIALMREGVRRRQVQPRAIMQRVPNQLSQQIVTDPTRSPFYGPFLQMPNTIPKAEQERLRAAARNSIQRTVVPAYERLNDYVVRDYLPHCRETVGIWDTPGGDDWYQKRIEWYTTTKLTADEIHEIGLREVARIRAEMDKVIAQTGFKGSFAEFLQFLRTEPRFRHTDPQQLLRAYMAMAKRIDPLLPQYFGKLPRMPYGVRPIPEQTAPDTTTAYYQGPGMDGLRAGYYYVNLYKPEERPTYEIPVLTIHEAVPGHHLQIALAQELGELPKFRRDFEATAFVEGWALYSESLGEEMGLYTDPYDKFGQLTYEMWRAVRLVVDTGMHHKRWTRQQAIDFFKANAAKTELDIVNEVDRYIAWPGQALAYKIGELKIKQLRQEATSTLGTRFDLRAFHDAVLANGAIPLDVLEANVRRWMASRGTMKSP